MRTYGRNILNISGQHIILLNLRKQKKMIKETLSDLCIKTGSTAYIIFLNIYKDYVTMNGTEQKSQR